MNKEEPYVRLDGGHHFPAVEATVKETPEVATERQIDGAHYMLAIQPAEFIHKNGLGYFEGNVIKYLCRHEQKGRKEDLEKAKHYIDLLIEFEYGDQSCESSTQ